MASVVINGDTSGGITLSAPAVAGSNTYTLAPATGNITPIVSGTAIASTSGTSVDFVLSSTIAPYVKRVTVMFSGVSTNGTSLVQVQIGSGSFTTSGYVSASSTNGANATSTTGLLSSAINTAADSRTGIMIITNITSNTWVMGANVNGSVNSSTSGGSLALSGALDRVRITTVNGTDTFDAGSINIMYEG